MRLTVFDPFVGYLLFLYLHCGSNDESYSLDLLQCVDHFEGFVTGFLFLSIASEVSVLNGSKVYGGNAVDVGDVVVFFDDIVFYNGFDRGWSFVPLVDASANSDCHNA